jgi:hypothetical protein
VVGGMADKLKNTLTKRHKQGVNGVKSNFLAFLFEITVLFFNLQNKMKNSLLS